MFGQVKTNVQHLTVATKANAGDQSDHAALDTNFLDAVNNLAASFTDGTKDTKCSEDLDTDGAKQIAVLHEGVLVMSGF